LVSSVSVASAPMLLLVVGRCTVQKDAIFIGVVKDEQLSTDRYDKIRYLILSYLILDRYDKIR
jgi:hypothetical protein